MGSADRSAVSAPRNRCPRPPRAPPRPPRACPRLPGPMGEPFARRSFRGVSLCRIGGCPQFLPQFLRTDGCLRSATVGWAGRRVGSRTGDPACFCIRERRHPRAGAGPGPVVTVCRWASSRRSSRESAGTQSLGVFLRRNRSRWVSRRLDQWVSAIAISPFRPATKARAASESWAERSRFPLRSTVRSPSRLKGSYKSLYARRDNPCRYRAVRQPQLSSPNPYR